MFVLILIFLKFDILKSVIAEQSIPHSKTQKVNIQQVISCLLLICHSLVLYFFCQQYRKGL